MFLLATKVTFYVVALIAVRRVLGEAGATDRDMQRLLTDLVSYSKDIRPMRNFSETLTIAIGLKLHDIIDSEGGILTARVTVEQVWNNYWMRWKPEAYGGIKHSVLPAAQIWHPDTALYNSVDVEHYFHGPTIKVYYTGYQEWKSTQTLRVLCSEPAVFYTTVKDSQCSFTLGSWTYEGHLLDIQHKSGRFLNTLNNEEEGDKTKTWKVVPGLDLSEYRSSYRWNITKAETLNTINYQRELPLVELKFQFTMTRLGALTGSTETLIWILLMFLPLVTFLVPVEFNQKVLLAGVNFLLAIVTIIGSIDRTRQNCSSPPQNFYLYALIVNLLGIVGAVGVVGTYSRNSAMSKWVKKCLGVFAKITFVANPNAENNLCTCDKRADHLNCLEQSTSPGLDVISKHLKEEEAVESMKCDWFCLATVINRACFSSFSIVFALGLIMLFCF